MQRDDTRAITQSTTPRPSGRPSRLGSVMLIAWVFVAGCHGAGGTGDPRTRHLSGTAEPREEWRFRVPEDSSEFDRFAEPISDEFALIEVSDAQSWQRLISALRLVHVPDQLDFTRGRVVGVVASVGAPVSSDWPISIEHIRLRAGIGSLTARVADGLYNPVRTAPFGVLAYFPGLKRLSVVRINHRVFYLGL